MTGSITKQRCLCARRCLCRDNRTRCWMKSWLGSAKAMPRRCGIGASRARTQIRRFASQARRPERSCWSCWPMAKSATINRKSCRSTRKWCQKPANFCATPTCRTCQVRGPAICRSSSRRTVTPGAADAARIPNIKSWMRRSGSTRGWHRCRTCAFGCFCPGQIRTATRCGTTRNGSWNSKKNAIRRCPWDGSDAGRLEPTMHGCWLGRACFWPVPIVKQTWERCVLPGCPFKFGACCGGGAIWMSQSSPNARYRAAMASLI